MARTDFIIIGAMKCATSTLHEQLARQPGVFMSEPKEPNFFSDDGNYQRGTGWYDSLFAQAPAGALCGESSTHYTKLPTYPHTISRLKAHLPNARFIYLMRDPIKRLQSQYVHQWTEGEISLPLEQALVKHPELVDYSRYATQLKPFIEQFGLDSVLPVFTERLQHEPERELERICRFIGLETSLTQPWDHSLERQNRSAMRLKKSPWRDRVLNLPGARQLRQTQIPQSVRNRIKSLWQMQKPPTVTPEIQARLQSELDPELATLGQWLGSELDCDNFSQVVRRQTLEWSDGEPEHRQHNAEVAA